MFAFEKTIKSYSYITLNLFHKYLHGEKQYLKTVNNKRKFVIIIFGKKQRNKFLLFSLYQINLQIKEQPIKLQMMLTYHARCNNILILLVSIQSVAPPTS